MTSPSGSTPTEAKAFLDAHPEIEAFDIVLTDANGIGRGKIVRRHELMGIFEGGRHLPISILGLDITGEDVHETGLVWDTGDGDLRAWPIPGTLDIVALMVPHIGAGGTSSIMPMSRRDAMIALAPSGIAQMPGERESGFRFFSDLTRLLPCYRLSLGTDPGEIAGTIADFLARGAS
ncbi:MAG: hypothetical protein E5V40_20600 [Mesorhizobium sp.]|nr:MAG: hypothetical protein E5V40_20600 [Mesorhizobium sp.]